MPSLRRLAEEPGFRVSAVVSQPDRATGRHAEISAPAVARFARERALRLLQPAGIRGDDFALLLRAESPDAIVVVAYGRILPREILDIPPLGAINVHGSLLPRHRGASPVQAAILAGDAVTGVSTMRMTEGLDEGPVFAMRETPIATDESAPALSSRLATMGADLLVETLRGVLEGSAVARPQTGEPTYCRPIRREDGRIDWRRPAGEILRMRRAFDPWPGIFTSLAGETVKILDAAEGGRAPSGPPGSIVASDDGFSVVSGSGTSVAPLRLQRAGRNPTTAGDFLRGLRSGSGELRFGD